MGVLKELLRSDSDNLEEDEGNLFFLFSISNSGDVNSLFLLTCICGFGVFSVSSVITISSSLFMLYIWTVTVLLKKFARTCLHQWHRYIIKKTQIITVNMNVGLSTYLEEKI